MVSEVLQIIFAAKLIQIFPCKQSCRLETGKNVKNCKQIENKFQSWFEKLIFWRKISKTPYLDVFFKNITVKQVSFQKHLETIFLPFLLMRIKTKLQLRLITPQDYKASCADFFLRCSLIFENEEQVSVKSARIRSFSDPYFPAFGLNSRILEHNLHKTWKTIKN